MIEAHPPFWSAFANNFYLTQEWAEFWHRVTGRQLGRESVAGCEYQVLDGKVVGISAFSDKVAAHFKQNKVGFVNVLPIVNRECPRPSLLEYSIWFKSDYATASSRYKRSFRKAVRQSRSHPIRITMRRGIDMELIQRIYPVHERQMRRLNAFVYPPSYFEHYLRMESAFCVEIECGLETAGYVFGAEYADNVYLSVGGVDARFFEQRAANAMYDYFIRYAAENDLCIHFGLGVAGSGFDKFKEDAGAIAFKIERQPDDRRLMKLLLEAGKHSWYGTLAGFVSRRFPRFMAYQVMPTT